MDYMQVPISRVYDHYKTPLRLRRHMLRAAGVAQIICENWKGRKMDTKGVVATMLIHDLPKIVNIANSSLTGADSREDGKPVRYWLNLKKAYIEKYGSEEHIAVFNMANEMGIGQRESYLALNIFLENPILRKTKDSELKVCVYSDLRVSPSGVTTLDYRIKDVEERYRLKYPKEMIRILYTIEQDIMRHTKLDPLSITEEDVAQRIKKLEGFNLNIHKGSLHTKYKL